MTVTSFSPRTGRPAHHAPETTDTEVDAVMQRAAGAAPLVAVSSPTERRRWLRAVADMLDAHAAELAELTDLETALGRPRIDGEIPRTADQFRFYGDVAVEGSHVDLTIDESDDPVGQLVRLNRPIGPVVVFGASNFPFVLGMLGHDTAAAIAAGCPVVAKAHSAHIGLSLRLEELMTTTLADAGAPDGTFAMVVGRAAGVAAVAHPAAAAVAFTGSQSGGLALWRIANERDEVIPVYAEMGTVNPVVVTAAAAPDLASIAAGFVGSFTLGSGQYCTKPGLLFAPTGSRAAQHVADALTAADPTAVMLTEGIAASVVTGLAELEAAGARTVVQVPAGEAAWAAPAAVLTAPIGTLTAGSRLLEECFGPVVLVCEYDDTDQLLDALRTLQGSLAASVFTAQEGPDPEAGRLVEIVSRQVGRVVVNGWSTGAACSWGQHHGGPWPATSNPGTTSIGGRALSRFVRPVTFQSTRDEWLPAEARADDPWHLPRRLNGVAQPAAPVDAPIA